MNIDRPALKGRAKALVTGSKPSPIWVGLVYLLLAIVVSWLSTRIIGISLTAQEFTNYYNAILSGDYDYIYNLLIPRLPSLAACLVNLALQLVMAVVFAGFVLFLMNTIRRTGACFGNLLDGFGMFGRIILLNILTNLFVMLWSLLFVVPGIIAAYRYRMALYLLLDHPEMSVMQCIRESKRMMKGHKGELFVMDLSFLGWAILESIPVFGYAVQVWTTPYISMSYVLYYEALRGAETVNDAGNGGTWREAPPWEG
ncbi:MAG: DUF975 family protein [Clostridiales bacterium]|nr:DUF975 family protein [Clostridiales bacterium]MCI7018971.1 DUF975 family protein [Clostridiales bacterium]